jgi:hypothetical protein
MLKHGLLTEVPAPAEYSGFGWRQDEAGAWIALRITGAGLQAVGEDAADGSSGPLAKAVPASPGSESPAAAASSPVGDSGEVVEAAGGPSAGQHGAMARVSLRAAAGALLAAWDAKDGLGLAAAMEALRTAMPSRPTLARTTGPCRGTKQQAVLALLRRPAGATVAQVAEATGWQAHTIRGFFAGLKKRGIAVTVLERARKVGPGKTGVKGSYTVYQITE